MMRCTVKKIIAVLLIGLLLFGLCACGSPGNILEELAVTTAGPQTIRVTFPEGLTAPEYGQLLEENGVCSQDAFLDAVNNPEGDTSFLPEIGNADERPFLLEGYLFPDTYEFYLLTSPQTVVKKMLVNYQSKITDEYRARAAELGYTMDEILRIASIIQEEATTSEMKNVSSVLHNRLKNPNGKLECDVTIFYLEKYVKPYVEDIDVYTEKYNAYKCVGLPAGPITNVGIDAIEAALYPADTDYFFFVTDEEMNFYYAVTYQEHLANVKKYYKK